MHQWSTSFNLIRNREIVSRYQDPHLSAMAPRLKASSDGAGGGEAGVAEGVLEIELDRLRIWGKGDGGGIEIRLATNLSWRQEGKVYVRSGVLAPSNSSSLRRSSSASKVAAEGEEKGKKERRRSSLWRRTSLRSVLINWKIQRFGGCAAYVENFGIANSEREFWGWLFLQTMMTF